jgi:hypothetical protein
MVFDLNWLEVAYEPRFIFISGLSLRGAGRRDAKGDSDPSGLFLA